MGSSVLGDPPTPAELGQLCVELAAGAAELVRSGRPAEMSVATKSTSTDLVTEVDHACERWLISELARRRPDDAILGEEGGGRTGTTGVRWVLDPIDGTVNFVLGIPQYAVSVAAEVDGSVAAGAVCNPATGEMFRAVVGGGAYLDDQPLTGPRDVSLGRAVVGTGFAYDARTRARQGAVVARLLGQVGDLRRLGGAALDLCFVAAGRLDAYFEAGLHRWDHAAGGLVATEAGCVTSGLRGRPASEQLYVAVGVGLAAQLCALLETLDADGVSR